MRLRTKLSLAFFFLAVVPLSGLTLYSYYSSLEAFRKAVKEEATTLTATMESRIGMVRNDLDRRLKSLGAGPFKQLMGASESAQDPAVYSELVSQLGDLANLIEVIQVESNGGTPPPPPSEVAAPIPPPPPAPPESRRRNAVAAGHSAGGTVIITMPGMPEARFEDEMKRAIESSALVSSIEVNSGNRILVRRPKADEQIRTRQESQRAVRRQLHLQWVAKQAAVEAEKLVRKLRDDPQLTAIAQPSGLVFPNPTATVRPLTGHVPPQDRIKCFDLNSKIELAGDSRANVTAQINASRIMGSVLYGIDGKAGEIPFAVDDDGRLYTRNSEDRVVLENLPIDWQGIGSGAHPPDDWVLVARREEGSGLVVGVAKPIGEGVQQIRQAAMQTLGYGMGMVMLALFGIWPISRRMTRNLTTLSAGAEELARGNLEVQVPVNSKDEFGKLSASFNHMARELKEHQARMIVQERLQKELEMCRQIQQEMLPRNPLRLPFAEVQGISIPAREVGGDFFNYFPLADGQIAILIGDVSGKGVPAALLMANIQATLRARLPVAQNLAVLAAEMDEEISASTQPQTFLTLFMAILDGNAGTLRWVNAGHNTQYLVDGKGNLAPMPSSGRPLGLLPGSHYREEQLPLNDGDLLFLYTDGLVEAEDPEGREFGNDRLEKILLARVAAESHEILQSIEEEVRRYRSGGEYGDDATMVILKSTGQVSRKPQ